MNNVLEFYIKMKDMMSGGLANLARNSKQTFNKMKSDVVSANNSTKVMVRSIDELKARLQQVNKVRTGTVLKDEFKQATREAKALQQEIDRLENKASRGGGLLRKIAPYASAAAIFAGAMSFAKASIAQYSSFEKSQTTYQVLTGNKGIGTSVSGELNNLKQNSILGTAVYPTAQMLMAFGDRADKVIPHIKMLGDVSMGDADKLHRLAYAFGEVESAGRLTGRQLMQMTMAGFNPLREMSRETGKSIEELRSEMRKGQITFKEVEHAFERATGKGGQFHDMMNKMADTTSGKVLMLKGKIAALEIATGERLAPAFGKAADTAARLVGWLKHWIEIPIETKLSSEIGKIRGLQAELTAVGTSHQRQVDILHELEQINPNIVAGIKEQSIEYSKLAKNIDNVVGSLQAKIFAETFDKSNAKVLTEYNSSLNDANRLRASAMTIVGNMFPDLAQNNSLSPGQKQLEAKKRLMAMVDKQGEYSGPHGHRSSWFTNRFGIRFRLNSETPENNALIELQRSIIFNNKAVATANQLQPKINEINKTKKSLEDQFNQYAGVKSMTATDIKTNPGRYKGVGGEDDGGAGSSVASGITGGGPRVININGVKFTDKVEIHANTMNEGFEEAERKLEEMFLRILNSGASVQ